MKNASNGEGEREKNQEGKKSCCWLTETESIVNGRSIF